MKLKETLDELKNEDGMFTFKIMDNKTHCGFSNGIKPMEDYVIVESKDKVEIFPYCNIMHIEFKPNGN